MISVLIPARNEAAHLPRLLARLREMPQIGEIIVADGGSSDQTREIAREMSAIVVEGARGRGAQQNAAAQISNGEILWFLHADVLPSRKSGAQIERAIEKGALGGNFRISFQARGFWPRLFEVIARFQRRFGVYYGDSGIWVTRAVFDELGRFENWPLFEDFDFAQRLEALTKSQNRETICLAGRLHLSARRFEKSPARVLWLWARLQIAFWRGASPESLARLYYGARDG
ncbi:MAG TPA: TIGR04283 family arsenosugar biosynthesis glycosyltransferase [Abditibacterium sp.]|jgi:rSAM/selenodomain-associated transferase 2